MKTSSAKQKNNEIFLSRIQPPQSSLKPPNLYHERKINNDLKPLSAQIKIFAQSPENHLLAALPNQIYLKLLPFLKRVLLAEGEYLYQSGSVVNYLYLPETAVISDFRLLEDGRIVETAMTGREGITDFPSFLSSTPAANWTQILISGTALRIDAELLRREFINNGVIQSTLFNYLTAYINQVSQRSVCNSFHSIEQRFSSWLIMLGKRLNENAALLLTQERIARNLGANRPTVSRVAKYLQKVGAIDYKRGMIVILDDKILKNMACECSY